MYKCEPMSSIKSSVLHSIPSSQLSVTCSMVQQWEADQGPGSEAGYLCMIITALCCSRVSFTPVKRSRGSSDLQVLEIRINPGDDQEMYEDLNHQVAQSISLHL